MAFKTISRSGSPDVNELVEAMLDATPTKNYMIHCELKTMLDAFGFSWRGKWKWGLNHITPRRLGLGSSMIVYSAPSSLRTFGEKTSSWLSTRAAPAMLDAASWARHSARPGRALFAVFRAAGRFVPSAFVSLSSARTQATPRRPAIGAVGVVLNSNQWPCWCCPPPG